MLTKEAIHASLPLAETLDAKRVYLTPVEESPLQKLVQATRANNNFSEPAEGGGFDVRVDDILYMANCPDKVDGVVDHHLVLDDVVGVCVPALQGHITFARTVAAPAVQDVVERTSRDLASFSSSSLLGMEIVTTELPLPLRSPSLEVQLHQFGTGVTFDEPRLALKAPSLEEAEIRALLTSGASSFDADVESWLETLPAGFLSRVWAGVFTITQADLHQTQVVTLSSYLRDPVLGVDQSIAIFLLAQRLVDSPIEGIEQSLGSFETLCAEIRNQAAMQLLGYLSDADRQRSTKILVNSVQGTKTFVNGQVYAAWIEAGGTNEVLYGNMLLSMPLRAVHDIDAAALELRRRWDHHAATVATVEGNRRFARTKEALERAFIAHLAEAAQGEDTAGVSTEQALELFRHELTQLREGDLKDLYATVLRLVARSRFAHTDVEDLLGGIERVRRENPSVDVREAAGISVLCYIARWAAAQFRVVGV